MGSEAVSTPHIDRLAEEGCEVAYADLDCSIIDELPPGRQPVQTALISNGRRSRIDLLRVRDGEIAVDSEGTDGEIAGMAVGDADADGALDLMLLTGRGRYVGDLIRPDDHRAVFLRSPHASARILHIDTAEAAAMPGVVVELSVAVGDLVEEGQTLLVLEAMKMQNPIKAEVTGKVTRIDCEAGQAVPAGAILAEIDGDAE